MREEIRNQLEKQEKIMQSMETLAAMKLQKMIAESKERAEILQSHKKLREQHDKLLNSLINGSIEGEAFVNEERLLLEEARAINREK